MDRDDGKTCSQSFRMIWLLWAFKSLQTLTKLLKTLCLNLPDIYITDIFMLRERSLTSNVTVQLVRLQAGDAGVFHAELQVVQLLAELLNVTFFAVQLHLQLIAIRALLSPLLQIHTTSLSC